MLWTTRSGEEMRAIKALIASGKESAYRADCKGRPKPQYTTLIDVIEKLVEALEFYKMREHYAEHGYNFGDFKEPDFVHFNKSTLSKDCGEKARSTLAEVEKMCVE